MLHSSETQARSSAPSFVKDAKTERATRGNILIVDDDPIPRGFITSMLTRYGYRVYTVADGVAGLQVARVFLPDLILLDVDMPRMNGYEVCERLKADQRTEDIPVVFLSARNGIADKVLGLAVGGIDYVIKPFRVADVMSRIERHLVRRKSNEESPSNNSGIGSDDADK